MTRETTSRKREVVAVICPHGIGNLIMTLPALLTLRRGFPSWEIHLVSLLPSTTEMLRTFPVFDETYDELHDIRLPRDLRTLKSSIASLAALRRRRPTMSMVTFPSASFHYNLLNYLIGAPKRVGAVYPDSPPQLLAWLNNVPHRVIVGAHDIEQNLRLVRLLGEPAVVIQDLSAAASEYMGKKLRVIGFHTGCKQDARYRQWRPERFAELIERLLAADHGFRLRIYFGPDEADQLAFFRKQPWAAKVELVCDLSLLATVRSISECSVFISNDSGLMHIAALTSCPHVIALFGPSDPARTGPRVPNARVLQSDLPCMPCSHTYTIGSHDFKCVRDHKLECLDRISVEHVYSHAMRAVVQLEREQRQV